MNEIAFDWNRLTADDLQMVREQYLPTLRRPDLVIATEKHGAWEPYLYRWHVVGARHEGAVYLHIQVSDDPEHPLHDHPWPNQSVIKAGGYMEYVQDYPPHERIYKRLARKGDVIHRPACQAHRLVLLPNTPYSISQFSLGRTVRPWGFWIGDGWYSHDQCSRWVEGKGSMFVWPPGTEKYQTQQLGEVA